METKVIVLEFVGGPVTPECVSQLSAVIGTYCGANNADVFTFSAKDLANITVAQLHDVKNVTSNGVELTPAEESIVYLYKVMKEPLEATFDPVELASAITDKVIKLKANPNDEQHKRFMNALFILSQDELIISRSLMRKYHFSQEKLLVFKKVYKLLSRL
jgi:hypothetical protein